MISKLLVLIFTIGFVAIRANAQSTGQLNYNTGVGALQIYMGALGTRTVGGSTTLGACASAGKFEYDTGNATFKYCNGTNWYSFASGVTTDTCSTAGVLEYQADYNLRFCNGTNWVRAVNNTHGYFVLTHSLLNGSLGGLTGANGLCLSSLSGQPWLGKADAQARGLLTASKVRAFLCDSSTCNNANVNTVYRFARSGSATSGGASFTTDASGLGPNNLSRWSGASYFNLNTTYWTHRKSNAGIDNKWDTVNAGDNNHCTNWTTSSNTVGGNFGSSDFTNANRWYTTAHSCDQTLRLICFVHP